MAKNPKNDGNIFWAKSAIFDDIKVKKSAKDDFWVFSDQSRTFVQKKSKSASKNDFSASNVDFGPFSKIPFVG